MLRFLVLSTFVIMTNTLLLTDILWRSALYGSIAFAVVGLARVLYLLSIYPNYVSPLRDLPGPKVASLSTLLFVKHHH